MQKNQGYFCILVSRFFGQILNLENSLYSFFMNHDSRNWTSNQKCQRLFFLQEYCKAKLFLETNLWKWTSCFSKGQIKSEWIHVVINFPNKQLNLKDFCPEIFEVEYLDIGQFNPTFLHIQTRFVKCIQSYSNYFLINL